jgi:hypothetical protein
MPIFNSVEHVVCQLNSPRTKEALGREGSELPELAAEFCKRVLDVAEKPRFSGTSFEPLFFLLSTVLIFCSGATHVS